jgi:hypothetical protein
MREMYFHSDDDTPMAGLHAIFQGARSFGLSDEEVWWALDDCLLQVGTEATVAEYLDELTGVLAQRALSKARRTVPKEPSRAPSEEPRVPSEEFR